METTMSHMIQPMYHPHQLASMVGDYNTELPDDVVVAMLNMMKAHTDPESGQYIGYYTPAEILHHTAETPSHLMAVLPGNKNILHIHYIHRHWITTFYSALKRTVFVCDSLQNQSHVDEIMKQVKVIYGDLSRIVKFLPVTQQSTNPICGPMAIAFAVAFFLNSDPSDMHFNISRIREHLKVSLINGTITQFPIVANTITSDSYYATSKSNKEICRPSSKDSKQVLTKRDKIRIQKEKDTLRKREQRATRDTENNTAEKNIQISNASVLMPSAPNTTESLPQHQGTDMQCHPVPEGYTIPKIRTGGNTAANENVPQKVIHTQQRNDYYKKTKTDSGNRQQTITSVNETKTKSKVDARRKYMKNLMAVKRQNSLYRQEEKCKEANAKSLKRKHETYKHNERTRETILRKNKREDTAYRKQEQYRDTSDRKNKRADTAYQEQEKTRESIQRKTKREDTAYRKQEQTRDTSDRKNKRVDTAHRKQEQTRDTSDRKNKRVDTAYRKQEQTRDTSDRKKKRADTAYQEQEKTRESIQRKNKREDTAYRKQEQTRDTSDRKKKRVDTAYRKQEQTRDTSDRKKKRADTAYQEQEKTRESIQRKNKREDTAYRKQEQTRDTSDRKKKRVDTAYRKQEQTRDTSDRKKKRADTAYQEQEKTRESIQRKNKREDTAYRKQEQTRDTSDRIKKRVDTAYRKQEQTRDTSDRKKKRADTAYQEQEKTRQTTLRKAKRSHSDFREHEQHLDTCTRKKKRADSVYRQQEKKKENITKKRKRSDIQYRKKEAQLNKLYKQSKKQLSIDELTEKFYSTVQQGPVYICTSCKQLFYKHSVNVFTGENNKYNTFHLNKQIPTIQSVDNKVWICKTCKSYISKGKVPPTSVMNKMLFPEQGQFKDLNPLEQNLLAVRLPFMKIHEAPRGKQKFIHGNMVLVPADVDNTVTQLPRLTSNTATIKATLKRKLQFKHHVYCVNIRPLLVKDCARVLSTKPLYKEHITLDNSWENNNIEDTATHRCFSEANPNNETTDINNNNIHVPSEQNISAEDGQQNGDPVNTSDNTFSRENELSSPRSDILRVSGNKNIQQNSGTVLEPENQVDENLDDDAWSEIDEDELTTGVSDTLLSAQDFLEPNERDLIYNFAPGEGSIPVSIFLEDNIEELAFPGIFCGERRVSNSERPVNITYGEIVKSELRNADRRAARSIENIFFKAKKIQMKILIDQAQLVLRKIKTKNQHLTVKDIRGDSMTNLIHSDKAYKALANIRGSPPYFEKVNKDLFAMIRQLGASTFFVTLSAAETRWTHLLLILGKLIDNKIYTEEEIAALTWQDKCRLIQSDPVTCARHFDYSVNKFLNEFLLTSASPLGEIEDYFYRIEYQNRGSPHIHMVIWCKNAPSYGLDPEHDICEFVDKYISCFLPEDDQMYDLVKLQIHRHSHTCRKGKQKVCRFGFPKPLFDETIILEPLSQQEFSKQDISSHKTAWKKVYAALNELDDSTGITYSDFLTQLQMTQQQYLFAVRSSIKTPTIFLKRSSKETRVNNYNPSVLKAWRANIDVQYILDVYACATYVASYLTKSQRGMSELLRKATHEANQGNTDIRHQVKEVGNKFLNAVEISAQEAVYICLQLPMKKSSRHVVFVNTSPPEERVTLLKPRHLLDTMDDDDDEIECGNLLSRYAARPKTMENITLAEFAASYEKLHESFIPRNDKQLNQTIEKYLPEPLAVENEDDIPVPPLTSDTVSGADESTPSKTKYRKRTKPSIIRAVHFNPDVDTEKYFRELTMLYFPWRNEKNLISGCETFFDRYKEVEEQIENCRKIYEPYATQVDIAEQILASEPDLEEAWNELAPATENENLRDKDAQLPIPDTGIEQYNIAGDLGLPISVSEEDLHDFHELPDQLYREHMRSLNLEQIEFVNDTIHQLKTSKDPIFRFLSGGAGVGKSFLIKALYQTALKYLNKHAGDNFTTRQILLLAPTGKAAYHIQASTIHNGLKILPNNKLQHKSLPSGQLNTLRNQIGNVKLLIIDEISMVGFRMFNCIHQRLQEVMQNAKPFGGVSVIAVGDLFQLEPVFDSYLFQQPRSAFLPLAINLWTELFKMYELKQIMRQADSRHFAELLNRLREGQQTNQDLLLLKTRLLKRDSSNYPHHVTHLMHKNDDVNAYNQQVILRSENNVFTINAKDRVVGSTPHYMRQKILMNFRNSHSKTCQLPNVVSACKAIHYDLTVNLNTDDGLTNGASCQIMQIDTPNTEGYASGTIWVKFHDQSIGKSLRAENKHLYKQGYDKNWTPIQPTVKEFAAGNKGQAQIQRCQFPLRPSHAKSIHRSQGDTLDEAVVDLTLSRTLNHIHYVAISRLKSLEGLHILNLQEDKISIDKKVQAEMLRLRNDPLTLTHRVLYKVSLSFKLAFLNARSLSRHFQDVQLDSNVQAADVICFCETRFCARDTATDTAMQNYIHYRQDFTCSTPERRPPYGIAIYSKSAFIDVPNNVSRSTVEATVFRVQHQAQVIIACLYKPPKVSTKSLLDVLQFILQVHIKDSKSVILGDLNINWNEETSDKQALHNLMHRFNFQQIVKQPTNDFNSTIDLIFTNMDKFENGTLEAYYSDHKLCWIGW